MAHTDPWQVYAENGLQVDDKSATREEFSTDRTLIMAASHVWVWRKVPNGIEVLLQKRSATKRTWPGYLDISAAGHIDVGESPVAAAVREAREEIDLNIVPDELYYIFSLRTPLDSREFDTVYLYELKEATDFNFADGEVDELLWKTLEEFEIMVNAPQDYNLVPQGKEYFSLVIAALRRV